ncbi:hypothetical protein [Azospirillum sp. TSO22-1]|uniref:hypothetical protein n=1 Tax=Azospirillum sp. TSO22-1 TaxID=716789 RepID=UPI001304D7EE|nr:hypothetical protein [Azospirillum sp. TSO22-1]
MQPTDLTLEEKGWILCARSLDPDLRAWLVETAEAIADGRETKPFRRSGAGQTTGRA